MKHITVGTAGHVDHGKTALVGALTGSDTDRLKEEKARGISIVLGFAYLELPGGTVDLIDVPGHERFVKTMISGATGLEAVLLVVAADEGVMPQTLEHLEIAELLGVRRGVVVVTKSDLASPDDRSLVLDDIRGATAATFLADAPVVFTSVRSGEGLGDLKVELERLLADSAPAPETPYVYLPIDRVFTAAGFGTVVTGTLRRGRVRLGETLELTPSGLRAEVRSLQVHGKAVTVAETGWRTAVNLRGLKKTQLAPGDALVTPKSLTLTRLYDAELRLLPSAPKSLKNAEQVRLAFGTTELTARVRLLEGQTLTPGETSTVQIRFDAEVAVPFREPFVIRRVSPLRTVGGGLLLGPEARKHRRFDSVTSGHVRTLASGTLAEVVVARLGAAGLRGYRLGTLQLELERTPEGLRRALEPLDVVLIGERALLGERYRALKERALGHVAAFHREQPTRYGLSREALQARSGAGVPVSVLGYLLTELAQEGSLEAQQNLFKLPEHDPAGRLSPEQEALASGLEAAFKNGLFQPPDLAEVLAQEASHPGYTEIYHVLVRRGQLVPTRDKDAVIVFHRDTVRRAKYLLAARFSKAPFSLAEAREVLGTSRKYLLPLLDYLDSTGYTRRTERERFIEGELLPDAYLV